ncbi:hypothetical protein BT96DRAFT_823148 [Gymnopus androsaceus JB14]|uniref:Uncharacterized protein n=1 Tax=Gymnopus androsaceus JB14 TaxID=1447944 RepID=A0A6A4HGC0_9AGAR|nr:hypothetical protein BT96DRAFT_823148 [Gymnopus androsaceus JB14]
MQKFSLHAYAILVFGDMPAIAKLMRMKGVNSIHPCCACNITAIFNHDLLAGGKKTYYTPLWRPAAAGECYNPSSLPLRTHDEFVRQATQVSEALNATVKKEQAKQFGINGLPILSSLSSLSFPSSFPHDFMHILENIIPMLVNLWTGSFKGLDDGKEDYLLASSVWSAIRAACTKSSQTTPSSFGCQVPNIDTECHFFKAETWLLFATILGPVLLQGRFKKKVYYDHFVLFVKLINKCMQFHLTTEEIDSIEQGFILWVEKYEWYIKFAFLVSIVAENI